MTEENKMRALGEAHGKLYAEVQELKAALSASQARVRELINSLNDMVETVEGCVAWETPVIEAKVTRARSLTKDKSDE